VHEHHHNNTRAPAHAGLQHHPVQLLVLRARVVAMMLIRVQVFMVRASGDGCDFCAVMGDDAAAAAVAAVRNAIDLLRRWQPTLQVRAPTVSCATALAFVWRVTVGCRMDGRFSVKLQVEESACAARV
jgi:hypothetical protein